MSCELVKSCLHFYFITSVLGEGNKRKGERRGREKGGKGERRGREKGGKGEREVSKRKREEGKAVRREKEVTHQIGDNRYISCRTTGALSEAERAKQYKYLQYLFNDLLLVIKTGFQVFHIELEQVQRSGP